MDTKIKNTELNFRYIPLMLLVNTPSEYGLSSFKVGVVEVTRLARPERVPSKGNRQPGPSINIRLFLIFLNTLPK